MNMTINEKGCNAFDVHGISIYLWNKLDCNANEFLIFILLFRLFTFYQFSIRIVKLGQSSAKINSKRKCRPRKQVIFVLTWPAD